MKPALIRKSVNSQIRKFGKPISRICEFANSRIYDVVLLAALVLMCGIFVSCGGEKTVASDQWPVASEDNSEQPTSDEALTTNDDYSGKVVIKFKDGTDVRLSSDGSDIPFSAPIWGLTKAINARVTAPDSRITNVRRVMRATEEEVRWWREVWARRGVRMHDWNLAYYLDVPNEEEARALVNDLNSDDNIEYVEIVPIFYLTEVVAPDMSGDQGYLKSAAQGGLGVEEVWSQGIWGQNTQVIDHEYDWNFDHEILPIDETAYFVLAPGIGEWFSYGPENGRNVPANIEHGTAVAGIIAAQGNDINKGVKGIVPQTDFRVASWATEGILGGGVIFADDDVGGIVALEVQQKGITTGPSGCNVTGITGCVPVEASVYLHQIITDTTNAGAIVIEGAGNGSVNLNVDALAAPKEGTYSNFNDPANDSGAIMVGASLGADKRKAAWSNCGSRVDVFAWGAGVATAGYGDKFCQEGAGGKPCTDPDNPTKYTGQFGGTSAATAQIAGVAALVQSYVRKLVEDAGYNPKVVYLDSKQMRTILKNSGNPAVYGQTPNDPNPNCDIGVQPDMAQAFVTTKNFIKQNVLKIVPLNKNVVSGIRYDMDGDGRAELISFSRDHKWYIDLSSVGPNADHFGAWDLILVDSGQWTADSMLFPVVHDYNSDGRADLSLYDSINGKWYIKYTTDSVIASPQGEAISWDRIIDYSADPAWKAYSRPVPGDYDGDSWLDLALQTPDGHWLIDYGGFDGAQIQVDSEQGTVTSVQFLDHFGSFDKDVKYLTDEQLAQAPGWAWLPVVADFWGEGSISIVAKSPDGITEQNKLLQGSPPNFNDFAEGDWPQIYGDNSSYLIHGSLTSIGGGDDLASKDVSGFLKIFEGGTVWSMWGDPLIPEPNGIYGDILCRPVPADYDGDGKDDLAVQCGTAWKIVYSTTNQVREVELNQALDPVPAYVYSGGIKYQDQLDLFNYYKIKLPCDNGQKCVAGNTIFDVLPPIGPYFAECVKYWAPNAVYCWDK